MFQDTQSKVYLYLLFTFQNRALCCLQGFGVYFVSVVFSDLFSCVADFFSLSSLAIVSN